MSISLLRWTGETVFAPGSIVKHQRELFKAEGLLCVASEPGNPVHLRFQVNMIYISTLLDNKAGNDLYFPSVLYPFQILFSGSSFSRLLLGFHVSLILIGMLVLLRTTEWYQVVSISSLLTTSLYTFIRLGKSPAPKLSCSRFQFYVSSISYYIYSIYIYILTRKAQFYWFTFPMLRPRLLDSDEDL
jgi:hypothetical protein